MDFFKTFGMPQVTALFGTVTMLWNQIVSLFNTIKSFIFPTYFIQSYNNPQLVQSVIEKILLDYKIAEGQVRFFIKPKAYGKDNEIIYPLLEYLCDDIVILRHKKKLLNFIIIDKDTNYSISISAFRWNFNLKWLKELEVSTVKPYFYVKYISNETVVASNAERDAKSSVVASLDWVMYKKELLVSPFNEEFNLVYTPLNSKYPAYQLPVKLEPLLAEIKKWVDAREFYAERGITWKRGYCLYGKPGTGKSSLVRFIAQNLSIPVAVIDVASATDNSDLRQLFSRANLGTPHIVLIEDIDAVFHGRTLVTKDMNSSLSFDALLNELDGMNQESGRLVFVTTNNLELLDDALIRPGRLDKLIEVPFLDQQAREGIINKILHGFPEAIEEMKQHTEISAAELQEKCVAKALELYENSSNQG